MAQSSQLNLTASITIDQSKLDADIRLARAKMQQLSKDANAAAKAAVQPGGDRAAFDAASAAASQQDQVLQGLTRQKKELLATTNQLTAAHVREARGLEGTTRSILEFGRAAGITTVKVKDLRLGIAGLVSAEAIKAINEAFTKISDIVDLSKQTGLDPRMVQGFGRSMEIVGEKAEIATGALQHLFGQFDASRQRAFETFWKNTAEGAEKAAAPLNEFDKQLYNVGVTAASFANTPLGRGQFLQAVAKGISDLNKQGRIDEANIASVALLGKNYQELKEAIEAAATSDVSKLSNITAQSIEATKQYNIALSELKNTVSDLAMLVIPDILPGLKGTIWEIKQIVYWTQYAIGLFKEMATDWGSTRPQDFSGEVVGGGGGPGAAAGGYVRGPGSGTSDSIAARLSNGEFVLNAASVRRLGVGFLHGLNSFAAGGLVGASPIRFAEGGLVSAVSSSGRPVHLHLGGSSFALSGSSGVVDALVSHAHSQQVRSAGVKPSWFAGRPSGR